MECGWCGMEIPAPDYPDEDVRCPNCSHRANDGEFWEEEE